LTSQALLDGYIQSDHQQFSNRRSILRVDSRISISPCSPLRSSPNDRSDLVHPYPLIHLSSTLAGTGTTRTTLGTLLGHLWCTGTDGLRSRLLLLLVLLLGLGLGDGGLAGSGTDLGLGGTFGEDGGKVGADNTTLQVSASLTDKTD
jgi:hypothetical protein